MQASPFRLIQGICGTPLPPLRQTDMAELSQAPFWDTPSPKQLKYTCILVQGAFNPL